MFRSKIRADSVRLHALRPWLTSLRFAFRLACKPAISESVRSRFATFGNRTTLPVAFAASSPLS